MESTLETVTIPLHKFRQMEQEISILRKENLQKTIYKEIMPRVYGQCVFAITILGIICIVKFT